jgi:DtxR family Mn-dependent transcriptional regulator
MMASERIPLSESVQNYLVGIARLREAEDQPVPLSGLAKELSVSPISVNEMCRKLQDQELVIYIPYKGVLLTPKGQRRAYYILRRHRLWEVFLVERLGFDYGEAHDAACRLEHATPDRVADQLDVFLEYPQVNPEGEPIPRPEDVLPECHVLPLSELEAGTCGYVIRFQESAAARAFLDEQGLRPGATVEVLATSAGSMLVAVGTAHISLSRSLAAAIEVEPVESGNGLPCTLEPISQPASAS